MGGGGPGPRGGSAALTEWVISNGEAVTVDGATVYDLGALSVTKP
ncbi:MAG: hypothetical protein NVS1B1_01330 [Candidatus Limnocylindrales bacterium]